MKLKSETTGPIRRDAKTRAINAAMRRAAQSAISAARAAGTKIHTVVDGKAVSLDADSFGSISERTLIRAILKDFPPKWIPGAKVLYAASGDGEVAEHDAAAFAKLGLVFDPSEKMPDVVFHDTRRRWLVLVEAVASDGAVDGKRRMELKKIFATKNAGLVFVTAFADKANMSRHIADVAWETEVWLASDPDHMIHLNGDRFLGPVEDMKAGL